MTFSSKSHSGKEQEEMRIEGVEGGGNYQIEVTGEYKMTRMM